MPLAEVEVGKLVEVMWVSLLAGVGISAVFSIVVYSGARSGEARRSGNGALATAFAVLAVLAFTAFIGGVIVGVTIMLHK